MVCDAQRGELRGDFCRRRAVERGAMGAFIPVMLLVFITGFCFGSMALVVTAIAKNYDFFLYYFTLVIASLMLLSGVFFPLDTHAVVDSIGSARLAIVARGEYRAPADDGHANRQCLAAYRRNYGLRCYCEHCDGADAAVHTSLSAGI